ncbi:helix-turn-helix transcriptional regulator [Pseudoduganella ginsengisoli]|uniref:Helix-turn-helix domain-containing protein n=1 Tax=Pseudoduganella ginsengisoli TaxID=1462440 RepID=A0A6L6PWG5_9BURK|nr:helix-turn-helix transcriptional regulator [Pseudoduganella ginsengisoli]MTW01579.1 helix-turn-helix domain-containing protein [Pseudoduganella ginsengisoli]
MHTPAWQYLESIDRATSDVSCKPNDYAAGVFIERHRHNKHQLVYAVQGVLCVHSDHGQWIVPPNRAIWMPAGVDHWIRCIGITLMRSVYVHPRAAASLPIQADDRPRAVAVTPLLRELIVAAMAVPQPYVRDSRDGRLMALLVDELQALPTLPLHLPQPRDARLRAICNALRDQPASPDTLADWAGRIGIDVKTIQRLFARETGMTFGQWRQQTRLLGALERLAQGHKVVDVALDLGYDSPSAFATMFKRQFGQTPSRFFA